MKNISRKQLFIISILFSVLMAVLVIKQPFYALDRFLMDELYQKPSVPNQSIKIIAIDEKTLAQFGTFGTWSRDIYATVIDNICKDAKPSVIGFDISFKSEMDLHGDSAFAESTKNQNVVIANTLVFENNLQQNQANHIVLETMHVKTVEQTYNSLAQHTVQGFSNAMLDFDGTVRKALLYVDYQGEQINCFAYEVASLYAKEHNIELTPIRLDKFHQFGIKYSGNVGDYEAISFADVYNGKIDSRIFEDSIVLIGAYASGMQDAYHTSIESDQKMNGVEIQANIIESILYGKYYQSSSFAFNLWTTLIIYIICLGIIFHLSFIKSIFASLIMIVIHCIVGIVAFKFGYEIPLINLCIGLIVACVTYVGLSYFTQRLKARQIESVLRKYIAPQVVDEVMKSGQFELQLGGVTKDIAVLFVDIRGFTTLSEQVEPAVVVEILNKYLSFTSEMVFKHHGTLDKFIGDATMAVFNSPIDLLDYEYKAVLTALDIAKGGEQINSYTQQHFGITVGFGVGVHCGKVVVGNIGSKHRMDFTAIGDTVNTASRLEGKAKAGQVLVSNEIVNRLKGRFEFKYIGTMVLKGKQEMMEVYEVIAKINSNEKE